MPLDLKRFDVAVAAEGLDAVKALEAGEPDGYTVHRVTVIHADQLVAEQSGPRYGLGELSTRKLGYVTLWCWLALRRTGVPVPEFPLFKDRCLSIETAPADDLEEVGAVDPTNPGPDTDWP